MHASQERVHNSKVSVMLMTLSSIFLIFAVWQNASEDVSFEVESNSINSSLTRQPISRE